MKITTQTPDLLIVEDRPVVLALLLSGFTLVFVGIGLSILSGGDWPGALLALSGGGMGTGAFALFVRRAQLVLNRPEGYVEFRRKSVRGLARTRYPLDAVTHAELETSSGGTSSPTYRIAIVIPEGEYAGAHPVTMVYSSSPGHRRAMEAINDWLGSDGSGRCELTLPTTSHLDHDGTDHEAHILHPVQTLARIQQEIRTGRRLIQSDQMVALAVPVRAFFSIAGLIPHPPQTIEYRDIHSRFQTIQRAEIGNGDIWNNEQAVNIELEADCQFQITNFYSVSCKKGTASMGGAYADRI